MDFMHIFKRIKLKECLHLFSTLVRLWLWRKNVAYNVRRWLRETNGEWTLTYFLFFYESNELQNPNIYYKICMKKWFLCISHLFFSCCWFSNCFFMVFVFLLLFILYLTKANYHIAFYSVLSAFVNKKKLCELSFKNNTIQNEVKGPGQTSSTTLLAY